MREHGREEENRADSDDILPRYRFRPLSLNPKVTMAISIILTYCLLGVGCVGYRGLWQRHRCQMWTFVSPAHIWLTSWT